MNQQQLDDIVGILQDKANQRYDNTLVHQLHRGYCDDSLLELMFEGYISYVDGINEVIRTIAKTQELNYLPIERIYCPRRGLNGEGENID